jgi:hypothetical protein
MYAARIQINTHIYKHQINIYINTSDIESFDSTNRMARTPSLKWSHDHWTWTTCGHPMGNPTRHNYQAMLKTRTTAAATTTTTYRKNPCKS